MKTFRFVIGEVSVHDDNPDTFLGKLFGGSAQMTSLHICVPAENANEARNKLETAIETLVNKGGDV